VSEPLARRQRLPGDAVRNAEHVEDLLAPFSPLERVRPRRPNDAELLEFAGVSRHGLYRLVASHEIRCEQGNAPVRKDGRRGAARIFVTLADVAHWRAQRYAANDTADAGATVSTLEAARSRHRAGGVARTSHPPREAARERK
jgi:hypothetical protein